MFDYSSRNCPMHMDEMFYHPVGVFPAYFHVCSILICQLICQQGEFFPYCFLIVPFVWWPTFFGWQLRFKVILTC